MRRINRVRKQLLCAMTFFCVCLATYAVSGGNEGPSRGRALTLVHISDTHVCNLDGLDSRFVEKRKHFGSGRETLQRFLKAVPGKAKADAVVVTGDLTDFYEAQARDGSMRSGEVEAFARIVRSSSTPLWLVLGNHDLASYWFEGTRYLNGQHNAQRARAAWIRNVRGFENGTWYSVIRRVGKTTYRLIFLDNGYQEGGIPGDLFEGTQLAWLRRQLAEGREDTNALFMHVPLAVADTNGDGIHFNDLPDGWPFPDTYQRGIMRLLNENPSVAAIFVGHEHRNVIEDIPFPAGHRITQIQSGNLQMDPNSWRIIRLGEDDLSVSQPGSFDLSAWKAPSRQSERSAQQ